MLSTDSTIGLSVDCQSLFEQHRISRPNSHQKHRFKLSQSNNDALSTSSVLSGRVNNMHSFSNNLLMDDSGDANEDLDADGLPDYFSIYYQFQDGSREIKSVLGEIRSLQKRKRRDAFGFSRGLENRLLGLWRKAEGLVKGILILDFIFQMILESNSKFQL